MGKSHERERSVWTTVLIAGATLVLGWATVELAFKPFLQAGRASLNRSLDPDYDPDDDLEVPAGRTPKVEEDETGQSDLDEKAKELPSTTQAP